METVLVAALLIGCLIFLSERTSRATRIDRQLQTEMFERLMLQYQMVASEAMETVKAASVEEKARVAILKEQSNVQLNYLRDTMAKQDQLAKERQAAVPQVVRTADGQELRMSDIEILG